MPSKITTTLFTICLLLLTAGLFIDNSPTRAANEAASFRDEADDAGKFALLIGIDEYSNGISRLNGAVADARAMEKLLTNPKFGFPNNQDHVKVLTDKDATGKNILETFRNHLIANAKAYKEKTKKEATIFFHYSGHGSQVKPPEGLEDKSDEPDGLDETIVPVDSGRNGQAKGFDIRDDEIFALVSELSEYTSNVVYVFDSCNSGTVNRGNDVAREVPVDQRKQPAYQIRKVAGPGGKDKNYDDFLIGGDSYVFIAGTQSRRKSYEINIGGASRGALSFYLERSLREATPQTSYAELMRRVGAEVNHHNADQEPQLAGARKRLILGGKFKAGDIPIPVVEVNPEQKIVTVGAGKMLGLRKGSLIAIHDKENKKIAEGEITSVKDQSAFASFDLLGEQPIKTTDTVKLLSPLFGAEAVRVNLQLSNPANSPKSDTGGDAVLKGVVKDLTDESKGLFEIDLLGPGQKSRASDDGINVSSISVLRSGFRQAFCGGIETKGISKAEVENRCRLLIPEPSLAEDGETEIPLPADDDEVFYLAPTGSGEPIFDFYVRPTDNRAVQKIADALRKYARQKNLLALENRGGKITEDLKIEFIEVQGLFDEDGFFVSDSETATDLTDGIIFSKTPDVFYRLRITNNSEKSDLHVTVLGLSNDGAINAMYPQEAQEKLLRGRTITTGLYVTGRPYGTERIKIIATRDFSDYTPLAQGAVTKDVRTSNNPLTQLLEQAVFGTRSSGVRTAPKTDDWGVAEISLEIQPK